VAAHLNFASAFTTTEASDFDAEVRRQIDRILNSPFFKRSPRLSRFLSYTVQHALTSDSSKLKEYTIALEVFGKPETFDPRLDSSVRVAARQLRSKLDRYYATEGRSEKVLIRFRPGDYAPRMYVRDQNACIAASDIETAAALTGVIIADRDRQSAHAVAECLDPAQYPVLAITDDSDRALSMLAMNGPVVLIAGLFVSGGLSGCELVRAAKSAGTCGSVAVLAAAAGGAMLSDLALAQPDAIVCRPVRKPDVETAVRFAALRLAQRKADGVSLEKQTALV
jgi:CheY-like chemotaxis protein